MAESRFRKNFTLEMSYGYRDGRIVSSLKYADAASVSCLFRDRYSDQRYRQ